LHEIIFTVIKGKLIGVVPARLVSRKNLNSFWYFHYAMNVYFWVCRDVDWKNYGLMSFKQHKLGLEGC
jgi:hypothetical protein